MKPKTELWLRGLGAAAIGGFSTAVSAGLVLITVDFKDFNLGPALWHTLEVVGTIASIEAVKAAAFYLKQSPLPPASTGDTTTITKPTSNP